MVLGIGCDIIEIDRVEKAILRPGFMKRCFTAAEVTLIDKKGPLTAAGNFCAKEAFVKALGIGFGSIMPKDIEVLRDEAGKPYMNLYGPAEDVFNRSGAKKIFVSISHSKGTALASVLIES